MKDTLGPALVGSPLVGGEWGHGPLQIVTAQRGQDWEGETQGAVRAQGGAPDPRWEVRENFLEEEV